MILDKVEAEKDSLGKVLEDVKLIGKTLLNFSKIYYSITDYLFQE